MYKRQLLVTAIQSNDYNVVIALSFIYSAMYIGIMLAVDILYGVIDPRIRLAKDAGGGAPSRPGFLGRWARVLGIGKRKAASAA